MTVYRSAGRWSRPPAAPPVLLPGCELSSRSSDASLSLREGAGAGLGGAGAGWRPAKDAGCPARACARSSRPGATSTSKEGRVMPAPPGQSADWAVSAGLGRIAVPHRRRVPLDHPAPVSPNACTHTPQATYTVALGRGTSICCWPSRWLLHAAQGGKGGLTNHQHCMTRWVSRHGDRLTPQAGRSARRTQQQRSRLVERCHEARSNGYSVHAYKGAQSWSELRAQS